MPNGITFRMLCTGYNCLSVQVYGTCWVELYPGLKILYWSVTGCVVHRIVFLVAGVKAWTSYTVYSPQLQDDARPRKIFVSSRPAASKFLKY